MPAVLLYFCLTSLEYLHTINRILRKLDRKDVLTITRSQTKGRISLDVGDLVNSGRRTTILLWEASWSSGRTRGFGTQGLVIKSRQRLMDFIYVLIL